MQEHQPKARGAAYDHASAIQTVDLVLGADTLWRSRLKHDQTTISEELMHGHLLTGSTSWVSHVGDRSFILSWDWIQLRPDVVALANPLEIASNARFVGSDGAPLNSFAIVLELNQIVHSLPWQIEVLRQLVLAERNTGHPLQRAGVPRIATPRVLM